MALGGQPRRADAGQLCADECARELGVGIEPLVRRPAGVKNLTDEVYKVDAQEFSSVGNIQTAYYGDPQTWQVIVGYRF